MTRHLIAAGSFIISSLIPSHCFVLLLFLTWVFGWEGALRFQQAGLVAAVTVQQVSEQQDPLQCLSAVSLGPRTVYRSQKTLLVPEELATRLEQIQLTGGVPRISGSLEEQCPGDIVSGDDQKPIQGLEDLSLYGVSTWIKGHLCK